VGPETSCAFAQNVKSEYDSRGGGDITISVHSPATGKDYVVTCSSGTTTVCIADTGAKVYF